MQVLQHALNYPEVLQPCIEAICRHDEEYGMDPEKLKATALASMGLGYSKVCRSPCWRIGAMH